MEEKRIAVLDLGTNTFHLLIAEITNGKLKRDLCKDYRAVKLGEGGINQGFITDEAVQRGLIALKEYKQLINSYQVTEIKAMATAAIRDAKNGSQFIDSVYHETGISIEIIDGNREAQLIYKGVRQAVQIQNTALIMDIGGGSVEFIVADSSQVFWKKSFPVGAARLMEKFHKNDPITAQEIKAITNHFNGTFSDLFKQIQKHHPQTLIGSAGAFETFAELVTHQFQLPISNLEHPQFVFNLPELSFIWEKILKSNHQQRSETLGIIPLRVDMIVVATVLTKYIAEETGIQTVILSNYTLREGILYDCLEN